MFICPILFFKCFSWIIRRRIFGRCSIWNFTGGGDAVFFFNSRLDGRWLSSMGVDEIDNHVSYKYIPGLYLYIKFFSALVRQKENMPFKARPLKFWVENIFDYVLFFGNVVAPGCSGESEGFSAYAYLKSEMVSYRLAFIMHILFCNHVSYCQLKRRKLLKEEDLPALPEEEEK